MIRAKPILLWVKGNVDMGSQSSVAGAQNPILSVYVGGSVARI